MFGTSAFKTYTHKGFEYLKITDGCQSTTPIVCLHGMFGGLSNFDPLLHRLCGYTVYVPNIPLYDLSKSRLTIPKLAKWLRSFITTFSIDRPVLLGNSLGGHIALEYACRHTHELKGLVLTCSSGLFENDFGSSCPRRRDREYIRQRACMTFYDDSIVDDTIVDELLEVIQSPSKLSKLLQLARSTHSHNMEKVLPSIDLPALLIWGRNDIVTPPEVAETFHSLLPQASLKWIDCCGHAPMMEHPDKFVYFLTSFLSTLTTNNPSKINNTQYEENYSHL